MNLILTAAPARNVLVKLFHPGAIKIGRGKSCADREREEEEDRGLVARPREIESDFDGRVMPHARFISLDTAART